MKIREQISNSNQKGDHVAALEPLKEQKYLASERLHNSVNNSAIHF
jgi:hypothetical protein